MKSNRVERKLNEYIQANMAKLTEPISVFITMESEEGSNLMGEK